MTRPLLSLVALLALAMPTLRAQEVTEVIGFFGDGTTFLGIAVDVAVTDDDTIFVAARFPDVVFKITPTGEISVVLDAAGDGQGNPLTHPFAIDLDAAGNVYVLGQQSATLLRLSPTGEVTALLTADGDGAGNVVSAPRSLAVAPDGTAYVACFGSRNVFRISPAGVVEQILDADAGGIGPLYFGTVQPSIALDANQSVYLGSLNGDVFKVDANNVISIPVGTADGLTEAAGVAIDDLGNLWVAETGFASGVDRVWRVTPEGDKEVVFDETLDALPGDGIENVYAMTAGSGGRVYVVGSLSDTVIELFSSGGVSLVFPVFGSTGVTGLLGDALTVDADGALYLPRHGSVIKLTPPSGWDDLGAALAGTLGEPRLGGSGTIAAGQTVEFDVRDVPLGSTGALVLGLNAIHAPFKGGTLVPAPFKIFYNVLVDEPVESVLRGPWPLVPTGTTLYAQFWVPDAGGVLGWSSTNAIAAEQL